MLGSLLVFACGNRSPSIVRINMTMSRYFFIAMINSFSLLKVVKSYAGRVNVPDGIKYFQNLALLNRFFRFGLYLRFTIGLISSS